MLNLNAESYYEKSILNLKDKSKSPGWNKIFS